MNQEKEYHYQEPFSREKVVKQGASEIFGDYMELIDTLSEAFEKGRIEGKLSELEQPVKELSEEEKQQLIEKETYGRLEMLEKDPSYQKIEKVNWYLLNQTSDRKDVIVRLFHNDTGFFTYATFRCNVKESGWENRRDSSAHI